MGDAEPVSPPSGRQPALGGSGPLPCGSPGNVRAFPVWTLACAVRSPQPGHPSLVMPCIAAWPKPVHDTALQSFCCPSHAALLPFPCSYQQGDEIHLIHVIPRLQLAATYGAPPVDFLPYQARPAC